MCWRGADEGRLGRAFCSPPPCPLACWRRGCCCSPCAARGAVPALRKRLRRWRARGWAALRGVMGLPSASSATGRCASFAPCSFWAEALRGVPCALACPACLPHFTCVKIKALQASASVHTPPIPSSKPYRSWVYRPHYVGFSNIEEWHTHLYTKSVTTLIPTEKPTLWSKQWLN